MSRVKVTREMLDEQHGSYLAAVAKAALTADGFETEAGMCQRWVRQVWQDVYGHQFDCHALGSADEAMDSWIGTGFAVSPRSGSVIGDILYKAGTARQPAGHVGIRIAGNKVAENSSAHVRNGDARGTRTLERFGKYDLIVRLPHK